MKKISQPRSFGIPYHTKTTTTLRGGTKTCIITKIPNLEQVTKHEPQSKGQVAQQVSPLANQDIPQEHQR